jgi:hypothetical protein
LIGHYQLQRRRSGDEEKDAPQSEMINKIAITETEI